LNVTVDPGFSVWKIVPIWVNVAFNDAAANTVIAPAAAGAPDAGAPETGAPDDTELAGLEPDAPDAELAVADVAAALLVDEAVVVLLELQLTRVARHSPATIATTLRSRAERGRLTRFLQGFR
jgi:hypothetical protein